MIEKNVIISIDNIKRNTTKNVVENVLSTEMSNKDAEIFIKYNEVYEEDKLIVSGDSKIILHPYEEDATDIKTHVLQPPPTPAKNPLL
jgi:hypothetical protein